MDVFHVGASAPKAPETRNVDRDAVAGEVFRLPRRRPPRMRLLRRPMLLPSPGMSTRLSASPDTREDVIKGMRDASRPRLFRHDDAARRAAQGILES